MSVDSLIQITGHHYQPGDGIYLDDLIEEGVVFLTGAIAVEDLTEPSRPEDYDRSELSPPTYTHRVTRPFWTADFCVISEFEYSGMRCEIEALSRCEVFENHTAQLIELLEARAAEIKAANEKISFDRNKSRQDENSCVIITAWSYKTWGSTFDYYEVDVEYDLLGRVDLSNLQYLEKPKKEESGSG